MDSKDKLTEIVARWQTAYFISSAMLTHYCNSMSSILNKTPEEIRNEITKEAERLKAKEQV